MFTKIIASSVILALALTISPIIAKHDEEESLPKSARKIKENVYDLGVAVDSVTGKSVRGRAFVHARDNGLAVADASLCYGYIASDTKWRSSENFLLNPGNNRSGLFSSTILGVFNNALDKWETAASQDIVGAAALTGAKLKADYGYPDGKNEAYFARLSSGTIAVTVVWYTYTGSIVETDQAYNNRYAWSAQANGVAGKMDLDNIVTHENGHIMGMDDQYDPSCSAVTMYGYADYAEIDKRTLEQPDITGIGNLY